jgi:predicted permease
VPAQVRQVQAVGVDAGVIGFAIVLTVLSGGLFGAVPAFATVRRDLFSTLRATDQGDESHGRRLRAGLVVAELALAVMLLVGAGLMLRSLMRLGQIDVGFRTEGLVTVPVQFPPARYSESARALVAIEEVGARLRASPAVRAAAFSDLPPLQGGGDQDVGLAAVGEPPPEGSRSLWYRSVSPNYLDLMEMRLLAGRGFGPGDRAGSAAVGIVNEETARRYWRGGDPVGRELAGDGMSILVVGVVANGRPDGPNQPVKTELFLPIGQIPTRGVTFVLDPADGEAAAVAALRAGLAAVDPLIPIGPPQLLERQLDATVAQPRLYAVLVGGLAAVALGLAALGVFGVMAYSVALRRREIGVRLALGAGPGTIHRLILRDGIRLAVAGGAVGLIGAAALSRLLGALLFEVSALDPLAYAGAALALGLVAVGAAWVPARRAMSVDPLLAMRQD